MFNISDKWNFWSDPTEVILVSGDHSHYIYFNGAAQPHVESLYPEIIALDAFAPETGLSSDGINLDIVQVISSGRSLGPPLQQLTDSLVNREFQIGNMNGDQSIDFELQGGSLHYAIDPYHIPSAYGVGYLQPSAANAEFIQQEFDSGGYAGSVYLIGDYVSQSFRDATADIVAQVGGFAAGSISANQLSDALALGSETSSFFEIVQQGLDESRYDHGFSSGSRYFALVEVSDAERDQAIYDATREAWLKPIFADTFGALGEAIIDVGTGEVYAGLVEVGVYDPAPSNPFQQYNIPYGAELTVTDSVNLLKGFVSLQDYVAYWFAVDVNQLIYNVTGSFVDALPDFATLDIMNHDSYVVYDVSQPLLDSLQTSLNNPKANLAVYGEYTANVLDWDLSGNIADGFANVVLFARSPELGAQDITNLVLGSSQTLTLAGNVNGVGSDIFQDYGFYYDASSRSVDGGLPSKLIIEDGAFLRVDADTAVHDLPVIVNDGMGVLDLVGGDSDETIFGTNGMDILNGAGGNDILYGGTGPDTFMFYHDDQGNTSGDDVIMDFNLLEGDRVAYQFWDTGTMSWKQGQPVETIEETYGNAGAYFVDGNGDYFFEGGSVEVRQDGLPSSIYEIYEVPGDRWANMITFGVRVKDEFRDMDFDNFSFALSWDTTEFSYVPGTFEAGLATTQSMAFAETVMQDGMAASYGHLSAAFIADSTYRMNHNGTPDDYTDDFKELDNPFNYDVPQYEIGGKKYDPYIAKFMLERIDESSGENSFTHFSSYAYLEENVELGGFDEIPVAPNANAIAKFDYGPDNLKVNVANPIGTYAPNPELFVSDGTIADGLSIVPVDKMGDIVVFQVMMNVSYPTTLLDTLDHANSASIEITADEIFTDSVYQRVDDAGTVGAVTAHVRADGAATGTAITTEDKSAVDFWDQVDAIADGNGDFTALNTASTITLDFSNIGDGGQIAQDGKYVLAEFVARNSDAGFDYSYYNNDVDTDTAASSISMYSQAILDGTLTRQIDDGSDVTVLGDTYYQNPFSFAARINSNDASTALKISVSDPGGSRYGEADFMSADYNGDGEVTSGDAYDILRTAAFMDPSDPDAGPFWSYVRDVDTASSLVNLGVAVPAEFDVDGNVINVPDLTPTITYDRTLDLFIGTDTVINATAVLTGDTDHNYMMLTSQQDPVLNHYDGFIGTWRAPAVVETPTTPATPVPVPVAQALYGTEDADVLTGTGDGNTRVEAYAGDDYIVTLAGSDQIFAGDGNDFVDSGAGDDYIEDGFGDDDIRAGAGDDLIVNVGGSDKFDGGLGVDKLFDDLSSGFEAYSFVIRFDTLSGVHGREESTLGQDTISGIENYELVGAFDAIVIGGSEGNAFATDLGDDYVDAGGGDDWINPGGGANEVYGGFGNDEYFIQSWGSGTSNAIYDTGGDADILTLVDNPSGTDNAAFWVEADNTLVRQTYSGHTDVIYNDNGALAVEYLRWVGDIMLGTIADYEETFEIVTDPANFTSLDQVYIGSMFADEVDLPDDVSGSVAPWTEVYLNGGDDIVRTSASGAEFFVHTGTGMDTVVVDVLPNLARQKFAVDVASDTVEIALANANLNVTGATAVGVTLAEFSGANEIIFDNQATIEGADVSGVLGGKAVLAYAYESASGGGSLFYDADGNFADGMIHIADFKAEDFMAPAYLTADNFVFVL